MEPLQRESPSFRVWGGEDVKDAVRVPEGPVLTRQRTKRSRSLSFQNFPVEVRGTASINS
jgi:hypothetical protein